MFIYSDMKKIIAFILLTFCISASYAQSSAIGSWTTHNPYQQAIRVFNAGDYLYCVSEGGVFRLNVNDSSMERITKQDGLWGNQFKTAAYHKGSKSLILAYQNTQLDIIRGNEIINLDDIFKTEIVGIKTINNITLIDNFAYISCGFGIVLLDLNKLEIKDTYYLGDNGSSLGVYSIAKFNDKFYAATDSGMYEADANNPNLSNYQNWRKHKNLFTYPTQTLARACVEFNGYLFAYIKDTLYQFDGSKYFIPSSIFQGTLDHLSVEGDKMLIVNPVLVNYINTSFANEYFITSPEFRRTYRHSCIDKNGKIWIANIENGFQRIENNVSIGDYFPNGPFNSMARRLAIQNNKLIVASGTVGENYSNKFSTNGIYEYTNNTWKNYNYVNYPVVDSFYDIIVCAFNPQNGNQVYGTFWKGIVEFNDNGYVRDYSGYNSSLGEAFGNDGQYRVTGIAFDSKAQMWVSNYWADKPISVRKTNGQWQAYDLPIFGEYKYVSDIMVDQNDQKWVVIPRSNAVVVFKENANGTLTYKRLTSGTRNGNLPKDASEALCVSEDLDGKIWVGTNKGLVVFYNPGNILKSNDINDIDGQPVKVVDGEFVQSLLENETITCIKVDGANRKWVGTRNGAWLFSADGTEQVHYFNIENSPLPTNIINDIAINHITGEVFFATDLGIVSYRSNATAGELTNKETVKVFPNPVKETYSGTIAIDGLVNAANVKITDIEGKVVYTTRANGAMATWNGKNFSGEKVQSGVYLVFSTDEEGIEKMVSKIVFIH